MNFEIPFNPYLPFQASGKMNDTCFARGRNACVGAFMAGKVPSGWVIGRNLLQWWVPTHWVCTKVPTNRLLRFRNTLSENSCDLPSLTVWFCCSWPPNITKRSSVLSYGAEAVLQPAFLPWCSTEACNGQYYFFWKLRKISSILSCKSGMNVSSVSSNEVPEVEEGLLSSEDIKRHNF